MELTARLHESDIQRIVDGLTERVTNILEKVSKNTNQQEQESNSMIGKHVPEHLRKSFLTVDDIKQLYGIGFFGLKPFRDAGYLTPAKFGKRLFYKKEEVEAILNGDVRLNKKAN